MAINPGRAASREESALIISGWKTAGSIIWSQCEIAPVAFSFRGKIIEFSDSKRLRFLNLDGKSEFVLDIKDDFDCYYSDPRDFPDDATISVCSLVFFFAPRSEYSDIKDFIALTELR
jgi:hypothetical protein